MQMWLKVQDCRITEEKSIAGSYLCLWGVETRYVNKNQVKFNWCLIIPDFTKKAVEKSIASNYAITVVIEHIISQPESTPDGIYAYAQVKELLYI